MPDYVVPIGADASQYISEIDKTINANKQLNASAAQSGEVISASMKEAAVSTAGAEAAVNKYGTALGASVTASAEAAAGTTLLTDALDAEQLALEQSIALRIRLTKALNDAKNDEKEAAAALKAGTITRKDYNNAVKESQIEQARLNAQIANVNKSIKEQVAVTGTEATAMDKLRKSYSDAKSAAENYTLTLGKNHPTTKAAIQNTQQLGVQIAEVEQATIKAASSTNLLTKGWSLIRQAAYLIPGLGIAGIFAAIGTAVVALVKDLNWFNTVSDETQQHLDDLNEVAKASGSEFKQAAELVGKLQADYGEYQKGLISRKDFLEEYNKTLGKVYGSTDDIATAEDVLFNQTDKYLEAMMMRSVANAALTKSVEAELQAEQDRLKTPDQFLSTYEKTLNWMSNAGNQLGDKAAQGINYITGGIFGLPEHSATGVPMFSGIVEQDAAVKKAQKQAADFKKIWQDELKSYDDFVKASGLKLPSFMDDGKDGKESQKAMNERLKQIQDAGKRLIELRQQLAKEEIDVMQDGLNKKILLSQNTEKNRVEGYEREIEQIKSHATKLMPLTKIELQLIQTLEEGKTQAIRDGITERDRLRNAEIVKIREPLNTLNAQANPISRRPTGLQVVSPQAKPYDDVLSLFLNKDYNDALNTNLNGAVMTPREKMNEAYKSFQDLTKGFTDFIITQSERRVQAKQNEIDSYNDQINALQDQLQQQYDLQKQGYANNVDFYKKEIEEKERLRDKAIEDQKAALKREQAAQKLQLIIDSAAQASSLAVSIANIWQSATKTAGFLGVPLAAIATGIMISSFIATKAAAFAAANKQYGEGGEIDGESHDNGGKKYYAPDGNVTELEGGEFVVRKDQYSKYKDVVRAINADTVSDLSLNEAGFRGMLADLGIRLSDNSSTNALQAYKEAQGNLIYLRSGGMSDRAEKSLIRMDANINYIADKERDKTETLYEDEQIKVTRTGNRTRTVHKS